MASVLNPNLQCCHLGHLARHWPGHLSPSSSLPLLPSLNRRGFSSSNLTLVATSSSTMTDSTRFTESPKPFSVLFVCLGNICRSPAAEAVFSHIVEKRGLESKFKIDSAGTIGYHEGNPADSRMRVAANKRGIKVTSISRPVRQSDFIDFDLIIAMDKQNKDDLLSSLERWSHKERFPENAYKKVKLLCSFCKKCSETEVPDPYYGGPEGFEKDSGTTDLRSTRMSRGIITSLWSAHS